MDPLRIFIGFETVLVLIGIVVAPFMVGQPRDPYTPARAATAVVIGLVQFVGFLFVWQALG